MGVVGGGGEEQDGVWCEEGNFTCRGPRRLAEEPLQLNCPSATVHQRALTLRLGERTRSKQGAEAERAPVRKGSLLLCSWDGCSAQAASEEVLGKDGPVS